MLFLCYLSSTYVGDLELLLGLYMRSWAALGSSSWLHLGGLGACVGDLGPLLGLHGRSWAAPGAAVSDPGPLLGPRQGHLDLSGHPDLGAPKCNNMKVDERFTKYVPQCLGFQTFPPVTVYG